MSWFTPLGAIRVPHPRVAAQERGFTLTELAIVGTLAVLVMLGLMGFYFNSQRMWLDGSTQAMTQRDATLLVDVISRDTHTAAQAFIKSTALNQERLELYASNNDPISMYEIEPGDGKVHRWMPDGSHVPVGDSKALRLLFETDGKLVDLTVAELISANGDTVRTSSRFQMLGGQSP
jgi:hypothetical protein